MPLNTIIDAFGFNKNDEKRLKYTLSRKEIANIAATSYETVIRVLSELDKQGMIEIDGKSIRIIKKDYFEEQWMRWN